MRYLFTIILFSLSIMLYGQEIHPDFFEHDNLLYQNFASEPYTGKYQYYAEGKYVIYGNYMNGAKQRDCPSRIYYAAPTPMIVHKLDTLTLKIPNDSITTLEIKDLPSNWKVYPTPIILSEIGEQWIEAETTIALKVPSCIIHSAYNFILNCSYPEFHARVSVLAKKKFGHIL